jgi:hypothetical protein
MLAHFALTRARFLITAGPSLASFVTILPKFVERDEERDDGRTDWLTKAAHFASGTRTSEATDKKDRICSGFVCCLFAVSVKSFSACVKRLVAVVVDRNWVPLFSRPRPPALTPGDFLHFCEVRVPGSFWMGKRDPSTPCPRPVSALAPSPPSSIMGSTVVHRNSRKR